jgi:CRISPR/Cas system-associated exonuclease Cas4 (RecB family)
MPSISLSKSRMGLFLKCPRSYDFAYNLHAPQLTDYPRLLGVLVHQFLAQLHKKSKNPDQRFYYKDQNTAKNAWFFQWFSALKEHKDKIKFMDDQLAQDYGVTGWVCIANYWRQNYNRPNPLLIEGRAQAPIIGGARLMGVFDQLREMSLENIKKFRPDIVKYNSAAKKYELDESYTNCVIIDYKTNKNNYDLKKYKPGASLLEQAANQFELHEDLQVTAYTWLYLQIYQKWPVGFFWYHLRTGKYYFTYRTEKDFETLIMQVRYIIDSLNAGLFPKVPGQHCKYCDFFELCAGVDRDRPLLVTQPSEIFEKSTIKPTKGKDKVEYGKQLRFPAKKFKAKRVKKDKPNEEGFGQEIKPVKPSVVTLPHPESDYQDKQKEEDKEKE